MIISFNNNNNSKELNRLMTEMLKMKNPYSNLIKQKNMKNRLKNNKIKSNIFKGKYIN